MPDDLTYEKLDGKVKITTWNIVSINSSMKKGLLTYLSAEDADVICLCETKTAGKVDGILEEKYPYQYWSVKDISTKNSYWAGVAVLSKVEPKSIKHGLGKDELDNEGRVIILEYQDFYLVHTYMPNASKELVRLTYKQTYNSEIEKLMKDLDTKKPVIWTGDLNVAHTAMDLARPDGNPKSAGFTKEERGDFTRILDGGFVDTWRAKHPKELKGYTYFGFRGNARGKYLGWRLDYFVVSKRFMENVHDSIIRSEAYGASDHVPIVLVLKDVAL
ncbi:exodeoxyribonuclease III [Chytridium lagenaria]|nr:exodeoxyribonuclease III [Chytridium lagenaria]